MEAGAHNHLHKQDETLGNETTAASKHRLLLCFSFFLLIIS